MKEYWFVPAKWTYYNIGASIKEKLFLSTSPNLICVSNTKWKS